MANELPEGHTHADYLGDGVYASFDGYHVWLRTQRENGWHEVALEPLVIETLNRYAARLRSPETSQARGS